MIALLLLMSSVEAALPELKVDVDKISAAYTVSVDGKIWLQSAPIRAHVNNVWLQGASLPMHGTATITTGKDKLGEYEMTSFTYTSKTSNQTSKNDFVLKTRFKSYTSPGVSGVHIFEHTLPQGATGTATRLPVTPGGWPGDYGEIEPIIAFPSFDTTKGEIANSSAKMGMINWKGYFCDESHGQVMHGQMNPGDAGIAAGPRVLYDSTMRSLVISPLDHFKTHTSFYNKTKGASNTAWELGIFSEVVSLPENFSHSIILVVGQGITSTMRRYGDLMQRFYDTQRLLSDDIVINKLGYWTDAGAYYYGAQYRYNISCCGEDRMLAVKKGLDALNVPIRYWQWDDWWYVGEQAMVNCVKEWKMVPDHFPSGLDGMRDKLKVPFLLYVPYWCKDNNMTDNWNFTLGEGGNEVLVAPEQSYDFHHNLFSTAIIEADMTMYEQDFMVTNFLKTAAYRNNTNAYWQWAKGMNDAACATGITLQYCMALPSDMLMSLEFNAVTNARASDDYANSFSTNVINYAGAALFYWALGVRPSKDTLWTRNATDSPYQGHSSTPKNPGSNLELAAIVAILSTGPVGISDKADNTDAKLVMSTCSKDGILLQPSKPLTKIDRMYSLGDDAPPGNIWQTYTVIGQDQSMLYWYYTLGINVHSSYVIKMDDFWPQLSKTTMLVHRYWHNATSCINGAAAVASGCVFASNSMPDMISHNRSSANHDAFFDLVLTAPVATTGWVFLGEISKFTSVSVQRFTHVGMLSGGGIQVSVAPSGVDNESIELVALRPHQILDRIVKEWTIVVKNITLKKQDVVNITFN